MASTVRLLVVAPTAVDGAFLRAQIERPAGHLEPPVAHVELADGNGTGRLAEVERSPAGVRPEGQGDDEVSVSPSMPPFSKRDLASITVAITGTVVLAIL